MQSARYDFPHAARERHAVDETQADGAHRGRANHWARNNVWWLAMAGFASGAALAGVATRQRQSPRLLRWADDAPETAARRGASARTPALGTAVTIAAHRSEVFGFVRDLTNLPRFMAGAQVADDSLSTRAQWEIAGPRGNSVSIPISLVHDRINECLGWESDDDAPFELEYRLEFSDAPGDRGTRVHAVVHWSPPAGLAGHWLAKALRADPGTRVRRDLKRLKMLMETGEIATSDIRRHGGAGDRS
ncbi:MAG: hypothetical protein R3E87_00795 [Burkholderiaceae bacterium]